MGLATRKRGKKGGLSLPEMYMEEREKIAKNVGKKLKSRIIKKK